MHGVHSKTCAGKLVLRTNTRKFINNLQRFVFSTKQMHAHAALFVCLFNCGVYLPFKYSHQIHTFSMQSSRFSKRACVFRHSDGRAACNTNVWPKALLTNQDEWILFQLVFVLANTSTFDIRRAMNKKLQKQLCNILFKTFNSIRYCFVQMY